MGLEKIKVKLTKEDVEEINRKLDEDNCTTCKHFEHGYEEPHSNELGCGKKYNMPNLKGFPFLKKLKCFEHKGGSNSSQS